MDSQWIVHGEEAGARLDKFLAAASRLGSRGRAVAALERGKVLVNDREMHGTDAARRLVADDVVRLWVDRPGSAKRRPGPVSRDDLRIVYEDAALVIVDKPAGLLSVPLDAAGGPPSVYDRIEDRLRSHGKRRPMVVHRIDRDTSGLVIFAKDARTQAALQAQFRRREPERVYLAVVHGCPDPPMGTWRDRLVLDESTCMQKPADAHDLRAVEAISEYRVVERLRGAALVEVRLQTGKRNQIRIQAGLRGHTLVGEKRYVFDPSHLEAIRFGRQALHAHRLAFRHPSDGRALRFEAPLPPDMVELISRLVRR